MNKEDIAFMSFKLKAAQIELGMSASPVYHDGLTWNGMAYKQLL